MLSIKAVKAKTQATFLFLFNRTQAIITNGFANQVIDAPPVKIESQPIKNTSSEVLHPLSVQKLLLKSEKKKSPTPIISTRVFSFDFSSTNICSSSENGIRKKGI